MSTGNCVTDGVASPGKCLTDAKRGKTCNQWQGLESVFPVAVARAGKYAKSSGKCKATCNWLKARQIMLLEFFTNYIDK